MRNLTLLASLLSVIAAPLSTSYAQSKIALDDYSCAAFLVDASSSANGEKLLRSMMMISWATGFAAAHQESAPRADEAGIQIIASTLGDECRKNPDKFVVDVAANFIRHFAGAPLSNSQPATKDQGAFNTYDNRDLAGGDLRTIKQTYLDICEKSCARDNSCQAFAFDKWNKWCFLKSSVAAPLTLEPSSIVGVRRSLPEPSSSQIASRIERRIRRTFVGSPYRTTEQASLEKCEHECQADDKCIAYTYVRPRSSCKAFDRVESVANDLQTVSGTKTQNSQ